MESIQPGFNSGDVDGNDSDSISFPTEDAYFFIGGDEEAAEASRSRKIHLSEEGRKIIVGVCAMKKKANSKPMREICERLKRFEHIQILIFEEDTILNEPVENWPICDCLISFYSSGFPLEKAVAYEKLRKPFLFNDLNMQFDIQDRRKVHKILENEGIDQPSYSVLDRSSGDPTKWSLIESEDQIEVNGQVFQKPFVEKPVSAEDHNVYIYYPTSAGGGSQRLFRKIGSRSSVYSPVSKVRKTGSYIYEEFMPTDGTDIKVYTLGPDYAHAEARKSPALDGKVERDEDGKEIRYPILLSAKEKLIARKVCLAFKQTVCGFDLLRASGKSYVCDVNGFSFVKTSMKYYDDCAKILGNMILREFAPQLDIPMLYQPEDIPIVPTTYGTMMELRCVIAVIRHGDRTPKQKMKMEVRHKKFFDLFEKYNGYKTGHLKLKKPKQLQEVLDIARSLLAEIQQHSDPEIEEKKSKVLQLKAVLEMYGHFSGINRKVQMKYQPHGAPKKSSEDDDRFSDSPHDPSLVLILKWGGELTPAGKAQAEELGKAFRCIYPGGEGDYGGIPGLGFLRLHSTFRHDLKIYASDEGRVQMTAAAFAKGLLALEGELAPILVQMVKSANTNGLLDNDAEASKYQQDIKTKLKELMNKDEDFTEEDYENLAPSGSSSLKHALKFIGNPYQMCKKIHELIKKLTKMIRKMKVDPKTKGLRLYHSETWELMARRWGKLERDFYLTKSNRFEISKIPDIYDCIKYDLQHNQEVLQFDDAEELYACSKAMADIIIPQEYGVTKDEKLSVASSISTPLLKKIYSDLQSNLEEDMTRLDSRYCSNIPKPYMHVRTRLYFTSESHIHSIMNILRYRGLSDEMTDEQWHRAMEYVGATSELNYMTQIVIMMYEDPTKEAGSDERFHVELHFSPGAITFDTDKNYPPRRGYRPQSREGKDKKDRENITNSSNDSTRDQSSNDSKDLSASTQDNNDFDFGPPKQEKTLNFDLDLQRKESEQRQRSRQNSKEGEKLLEDLIEQDEKSCEHQSSETKPDIAIKPLTLETADFKRPVLFESAPIKIVKGVGKKKRFIVETRSDIHVPAERVVMSDENLTRVGILPNVDSEKSRSYDLIPPGSEIYDSGEDTKPSSYEDKSHSTPPDKTSNYNVYHTFHALPSQGPKSHSGLAGLFARSSSTVERMARQGSTGSLFSTKIISGSSSAPDLYDEGHNGVQGCPQVPEIQPLETLHNSLTLKQMDEFLLKVTDGSHRTPAMTPASPCQPSTPSSYTPRRVQMQLSGVSTGYSSSACSSAGPSSPTSSATSDDIVNRLKQLMMDTPNHRDKTDSESSHQTSSEAQSPRSPCAPGNKIIKDDTESSQQL